MVRHVADNRAVYWISTSSADSDRRDARWRVLEGVHAGYGSSTTNTRFRPKFTADAKRPGSRDGIKTDTTR